MTREQILDWLDKNNRGFTQKDFELFEKFYKEATKELEKENAELKTDYEVLSCSVDDFGELQDKLEEEQRKNNGLEEKISVLLSCKNCPENKGGLICQKEYENKCLAQKIQFIKELQEENAELKGLKDVATLIRANNDTVITLMQLNNMLVSKNQQLTKAKEIIREYINLDYIQLSPCDKVIDLRDKAEQFISGVKK